MRDWIARMVAPVLCGAIALTGHVHAQQTATAIGPCGTVINASGHARVDVDVHCTLSDETIAKNLIRNSEQKQRSRDTAQDLTTTELLGRVDELQGQVERLTSVVATVREQAQLPDAEAVWKRAFEKLQQGDSLAAAAFLGDEADAAARSSASQRDVAVKLYRQQAGILSLTAPTEALTILKKALHLEPENAVVLREAGQVSMILGDFQGAARYYERRLSVILDAVNADPGALPLQYDLGVSYGDLGDLQSARGDIRGAEQQYGKAMAIFSRPDIDICCNQYSRVDLAATVQRFGSLRLAKGDLVGAEYHFRFASRILESFSDEESRNSDWQKAMNLLRMQFSALQQDQGDLLGAQNYGEDALAGFERLVAQDATNLDWQFYEAVARYNLARTYLLNEDAGRALAQLRSAREILRKLRISVDHVPARGILPAIDRAISALDASERKP